jgi:micrococcal nuclease
MRSRPVPVQMLIPATLKWIFLFAILALPATAAEGWSVIDGDTVRSPAGERVRILNIDAPEIHPCRCALECNLGHAAKGYVQNALRGSVVRVEPTGVDRYGRTLARVYVAEIDLGESLIARGLARKWTGRREPWCKE